MFVVEYIVLHCGKLLLFCHVQKGLWFDLGPQVTLCQLKSKATPNDVSDPWESLSSLQLWLKIYKTSAPQPEKNLQRLTMWNESFKTKSLFRFKKQSRRNAQWSSDLILGDSFTWWAKSLLKAVTIDFLKG